MNRMCKKRILLNVVSISVCLMAFPHFVRGACNSVLSPTDYLVFSAGGIEGRDSDFEGPTGAVGGVNFPESFTIDSNTQAHSCAALIAGGSVQVKDGKIDGGNIESGGNVTLTREAWGAASVIATGTVTEDGYSNGQYNHSKTANVSNLSSVASDLLSRSGTIAGLSSNAKASGLSYLPLSFENSGQPVRVYTVSAGQLERAFSLNFDGEPGQLIVVNVTGDSLDLRNKPIHLSSDMKPGQIILNFR
jgi:choice-of-anchor A domain-containing protein